MINPIVIKIVRLEQEAMKQKLYKTFHALDKASRVVGWELADTEMAKRRRRVK